MKRLLPCEEILLSAVKASKRKLIQIMEPKWFPEALNSNIPTSGFNLGFFFIFFILLYLISHLPGRWQSDYCLRHPCLFLNLGRSELLKFG